MATSQGKKHAEHYSSSANSTLGSGTNIFSLPLELRQEIYKHVIFDRKPSGNLFPRLNHWPALPSEDSLAILRTCRQINLEATNTLYGSRKIVVSYFKDYPEDDYGDPWEPYEEGRWELSEFYLWLQIIGAENRTKIKQLQINVTDCTALDQDYFDYDDDVYFCSWKNEIGWHIAKSLKLLASNHNLNTLEFDVGQDFGMGHDFPCCCCEFCSRENPSVKDFFLGRSDFWLALNKFNGLESFKLTPEPGTEKWHEKYENLQARLTRKRTPTDEDELAALWKDRKWVVAESKRLEERTTRIDERMAELHHAIQRSREESAFRYL